MKRKFKMLGRLIALLAIIIMTSCAQKTQNQTISAKDSTIVESDEAKTIDSGEHNYTDILDGWLKLGLNQSIIIDSLGEPEEKDKDTYWGALGTYVQNWKYTSKGISLDMESEKENGEKNVLMITITEPCQMITSKSIGIGTDKDFILKEYSSNVNPDHSDEESIVVGSIYGGVIFSIKENKVNSIFIGAAAE